MHKLIGKRFGKLSVIKDSGRRSPSSGGVILECRCDCGNITLVRADYLSSGVTQSCGCWQHHMKGTGTYNSWKAMKQRCLYPKHNSYHVYGGRGIKLYGPWHKFKNFLRDMGIRPNGYSISRIDHDGDYCPENCEWAPAHSH